MNERSRRSFDRAQAAYENNMGECSGSEDFTCPYCGEEYTLDWVGETGSSWFVGEEVCPHCGWPAPVDDSDYAYEKDEDKDHEAPCLVCGKLAHSVGYTGKNDEIQKLSCGHWTTGNWCNYAEAYYAFQIEKEAVIVGLHRIGEFDEFVKKHPEAGETLESVKKEEIRAWYKKNIGYDPFKDDPSVTVEEIAKIKEEYQEEGGIDENQT